MQEQVQSDKIDLFLEKNFGGKIIVHKVAHLVNILEWGLTLLNPIVFQMDMSKYAQEILDNFSEVIIKSSTLPHSDDVLARGIDHLISPCHDTAPIHGNRDALRHPDGCVFPDNQGKETR
jgi:hypothetical protein